MTIETSFNEPDLVRLAGDIVFREANSFSDTSFEEYELYIPGGDLGEGLRVIQPEPVFGAMSGHPESINMEYEFKDWLKGLLFAVALDLDDSQIEFTETEVVRFMGVKQ